MAYSPIPDAPPAPPAEGGIGPPYNIPLVPDPPPDTSLPPEYRDWKYATVSGKKLKGRNNSQQQATIAGAGSVIPILYGRRRVGGRIAGIQTLGNKIALVVVWCWGSTRGVDAIESFEVANSKHPNDFDATHYLGNQTAPDPDIVAAKNFEGSTYADILPGVCYSVIKAKLINIKSGLPTCNATIRGLKLAATDGGAKSYSNCPAYIIADFITDLDYGMGSLVNWSDVAALAAYNNETLGAGDLAQARSQLDILLDTVKSKQDWLAVLCDYAGCFPYKDGDRWRLAIDQAIDPGTIISLGAGDVLQGSLKLTKKDITNLPNVVEIIWTDPSKNPWADSTTVAYGAGVLAGTVNRRVTQLDHRGTLRYGEAYRYAVKRLNEATTADLSCQFTSFDAALRITPGDVFALTHPIGLTAKQFRCIKAEATAAGRWAISGSEYDPAKYSSDVVSSPSSLDSTFPSPFDVPDVTGLNVIEDVYQVQTGMFPSRFIISWAGPLSSNYTALAGFDVQIVQDTVVQTVTLPPDQFSFLSGPVPENLPYQVRVRARSALAFGNWATFEITPTGKNAPPGDVIAITGYSTNGETRLSWTPPGDLDLRGYELRYGTPSDSWDSAISLAFVAAPANYYSTMIVPAGMRRIFIKALDSVRTSEFPNGQPSVNAAFVDIDVEPNTTTNYDFMTPPPPPTATHMLALSNGCYITDNGTAWNSLFPSALNSYTNALASYSAGSSELVSGTIDLGAPTTVPASIKSAIEYVDISGTAQPYIEYKLNAGDAWTRVNATTATATCRYIRVGITTTGSMYVCSLGDVGVGTNTTGIYIPYSVMNDSTAWMGVN